MAPVESEFGDGLYDPRAVANAILDVFHRPLSNLALQKILYFVHGAYLLRTKRALVTGYFEAWKHGPVHPAVYLAFKSQGDQLISTRAVRKDLRTGELFDIPCPLDSDLDIVINKVLASVGDLSAGQLVRLSHAADGPWDLVFRRSKSEHLLGLRIANELIWTKYRNHWFTADKLETVDEPSEDAPLTYYRLG